MGSNYSIQKRADGWVISAGDSQILICSKRATAMCVVQQAAHLLDLPDNPIIIGADVSDDQIAEPRIRRIA